MDQTHLRVMSGFRNVTPVACRRRGRDIRALRTCSRVPAVPDPAAAFTFVSRSCPSVLSYCFLSQMLSLDFHHPHSLLMLQPSKGAFTTPASRKKEVIYFDKSVLGTRGRLCLLLLGFSSQATLGSQLTTNLELERNLLGWLSLGSSPSGPHRGGGRGRVQTGLSTQGQPQKRFLEPPAP